MNARSATALSPADHIEIQQLYGKYCYATDHGDGAARAALFTPDGSFASSGTKGVALSPKVLEERTNEGGNNGRRHLMMNIVITPSAEGADGWAYAIILENPKDVGPGGFATMVGYTGIYVDTLVRTADGWRFRTRVLKKDQDPDSPFRRGTPAAPAPWR